jgi:DNA-binding response OmpR family regulator
MVLNSSKISRKILEVILQRADHLVVSFGDSMEVPQVLPRREPADMLFLDTDLPKTDGFDLLKHLKGEQNFRSTVPVALLGECSSVLDRIKSCLAGAQYSVTKPLSKPLPCPGSSLSTAWE